MEDFFDEGYLPKEVEKVEDDIEEKTKRTPMFQTMATIVNKKYWPTEEDINQISSFMMVRYISNDAHGVLMGVYIDYFSKMPLTAQYRLLRYSLSDKISYIKFPKKEKADNQEELEIIMKKYKVNERLGMRYLKILPQEKIDYLISLYTDFGTMGRAPKTKGKR